MKNVTLLLKAMPNNGKNSCLKKSNPTQNSKFWPIYLHRVASMTSKMTVPKKYSSTFCPIIGFLSFRPRIWLSILHLSSQPRSNTAQSKSSKSGVSKSGISKSDTTSTFTCNSSCPAFSTATASQTQPFPWQPFGLAQISICRI